MGAEILLYGYGIVCLSMLVFNVIYGLHLRSDDRRLERLARRLSRQSDFQLQGQDYARPKGEPGPLLAPWYNKKSLSIGCNRPFDDLVCSPELADTLVEGFEFLLPYYMYFDSLCKTGLEDLK